jgi:hypothetical protein
MRIAKTLSATAAALGLVTAPIAAHAAPVRAPTPVEQNEKIAGGGTILYVALAAFAIAMVVLLADNDDDELPASP